MGVVHAAMLPRIRSGHYFSGGGERLVED